MGLNSSKSSLGDDSSRCRRTESLLPHVRSRGPAASRQGGGEVSGGERCLKRGHAHEEIVTGVPFWPLAGRVTSCTS